MKLGKDIAVAKAHLKKGELVAIPTETVYGLAANGFDAMAVARIYEAKQRPAFNPLILHAASIERVRRLVSVFPPKALLLAEAFWPGPLTLVLPKSELVPELVTAGNSTVAVRVPRHSITLELLQQLDFPLAAPSANPSGYISPTRPEHVLEQLGEQVAYVLDGGPSEVGVESTILKVDGETVTLLRPGGLDIESIEEVVGKITVPTKSKLEAPGMLASHYAPGKQVLLGDTQALSLQYTDALVLAYRQTLRSLPFDRQLVLSPSGNLREAASNLFSHLRQLDAMHGSHIIAELVPNHDLGLAINDRLQRAAAERKN